MYPTIMKKVFSEPWLVLPSTHQAIQQTLLERVQNGNIQPRIDDRLPTHMQTWEGEVKEIKYHVVLRGKIGYVKLYGIVGKHLSAMEIECGACSLDHALQGLQNAIKDEKVKQIVLDISSPGGVVTGVPEFATMIKRLSKIKPIYAYTENMMCSAAMWIGSACTEIIATPSATIGSIGVYLAWFDNTEKNKKEGRNLLLFEAGEHKAIGLRPPSETEMQLLQNEVNDIWDEFKTAITNNRQGVEESTMQGLTYSGAQALDLGLADGLVTCFDDALDLLDG